MKADMAEYKEDMAAQRETERRELAEANRRDWAQRNGNDSGFDFYADCEFED